MENNEQVSGAEPIKGANQKGTVRPNPTRFNRTNLGGSAAGDTGETDPETSEFDGDHNESEVNPAELDNEEVNLGDTGKDDSKNNGVPDVQAQQASDPTLSHGSYNRGNSGGAGGAQSGVGSTAPGANSAVSGANAAKTKPAQENLLGQGGYGTSGTSGTNSGGKQGYQSGIGSAGSQNGSTGYNAGSLGTKIDPNKNGDINHRP